MLKQSKKLIPEERDHEVVGSIIPVDASFRKVSEIKKEHKTKSCYTEDEKH